MATTSVQTESIARMSSPTPKDHFEHLGRRQGQNATSSTDSNTTQPDDDTSAPLNFEKRDITGSSKNKLFSQLSSLSLHSLNSPSNIVQSNNPRFGKYHDDENVITIDDRERISSPASTAALLASGQPARLQKAGNESFDNFKEFKSNSLKTDGVLKSKKLNQSPPVSPRNFTRNASLPELDLRNIQRFSKHYEPARAVLHRSELQSSSGSGGYGYGQGHGNPDLLPNSNGTTSSNGMMSPRISQQFNQNLSLQQQQHQLINSSSTLQAQINAHLYLHLGSSPESINSNSNIPLRQIRDLKQPLYVPAVLRPTESSSYLQPNPLVSVGRSRQPAKKHWVCDNNAGDCYSCGRNFTWYRRRHHCRKCGGVFCSTDVNNTIGLDHALNFNLLGQPCKACDSCANEFKLIAQDAPLIETTEQDAAESVTSSEWF